MLKKYASGVLAGLAAAGSRNGASWRAGLGGYSVSLMRHAKGDMWLYQQRF